LLSVSRVAKNATLAVLCNGLH